MMLLNILIVIQAVGQMVGDMFAPKKKPADFIVVGPFTEDSKRVTGQ